MASTGTPGTSTARITPAGSYTQLHSKPIEALIAANGTGSENVMVMGEPQVESLYQKLNMLQTQRTKPIGKKRANEKRKSGSASVPLGNPNPKTFAPASRVEPFTLGTQTLFTTDDLPNEPATGSSDPASGINDPPSAPATGTPGPATGSADTARSPNMVCPQDERKNSQSFSYGQEPLSARVTKKEQQTMNRSSKRSYSLQQRNQENRIPGLRDSYYKYAAQRNFNIPVISNDNTMSRESRTFTDNSVSRKTRCLLPGSDVQLVGFPEPWGSPPPNRRLSPRPIYNEKLVQRERAASEQVIYRETFKQLKSLETYTILEKQLQEKQYSPPPEEAKCANRILGMTNGIAKEPFTSNGLRPAITRSRSHSFQPNDETIKNTVRSLSLKSPRRFSDITGTKNNGSFSARGSYKYIHSDIDKNSGSLSARGPDKYSTYSNNYYTDHMESERLSDGIKHHVRSNSHIEHNRRNSKEIDNSIVGDSEELQRGRSFNKIPSCYFRDLHETMGIADVAARSASRARTSNEHLFTQLVRSASVASTNNGTSSTTRTPNSHRSRYNKAPPLNHCLGISIRDNKLSYDKLINVLPTSKNLRFLDVHGNVLDSDSPLQLMYQFPRLRHLNISANHKIRAEGIIKLLSDPISFKLVSLGLANCQFRDRLDAAEVMEAFLMDPSCKLVKLDLSFNNLGISWCETLARGLERNRSIKSLKLEHAVLHNGVASLLTFYSPMNFTELNLARNHMSIAGLEALVLFLQKNKVDIVDLSRQDLFDKGICQRLTKAGVRSYILNGCRLPDETQNWPLGTDETIFNDCNPMNERQASLLAQIYQKREGLSFSGHLYGNAFVTRLCKTPNTLTQLFLDRCAIDNMACKEFVKMTTLERLSVQFNNITATGVEYLVGLLQHNLHFLNLNGNKLRLQGARVLARNLPFRNCVDFTLGVAQSVMTLRGVEILWESITKFPLKNLDLRRSQLAAPLMEFLPNSAPGVAQMEIDLRDNPQLDQYDLGYWSLKMNKVHTDMPLSAGWACHMLQKSATLNLKEYRMSLLIRCMNRTLQDESILVNLDNNELWRADLKEITANPNNHAPVTKSNHEKNRISQNELVLDDHRKLCLKRKRKTSSRMKESDPLRGPLESTKHGLYPTSKSHHFLITEEIIPEDSKGDVNDNETLVKVDTLVEPQKILSALRTLRRILLRKCDITDSWAAQVFRAGPSKWRNVLYVDLTNNRLSPKGAEHLSHVIKYGVEGLIVDNNFIETFGLGMLLRTAVESKESRLTALSCKNNRIGMMAVTPIIKGCYEKNQDFNVDLDITENPLTAGDVLALTRAVAGLPTRYRINYDNTGTEIDLVKGRVQSFIRPSLQNMLDHIRPSSFVDLHGNASKDMGDNSNCATSVGRASRTSYFTQTTLSGIRGQS